MLATEGQHQQIRPRQSLHCEELENDNTERNTEAHGAMANSLSQGTLHTSQCINACLHIQEAHGMSRIVVIMTSWSHALIVKSVWTFLSKLLGPLLYCLYPLLSKRTARGLCQGTHMPASSSDMQSAAFTQQSHLSAAQQLPQCIATNPRKDELCQQV